MAEPPPCGITMDYRQFSIQYTELNIQYRIRSFTCVHIDVLYVLSVITVNIRLVFYFLQVFVELLFEVINVLFGRDEVVKLDVPHILWK